MMIAMKVEERIDMREGAIDIPPPDTEAVETAIQIATQIGALAVNKSVLEQIKVKIFYINIPRSSVVYARLCGSINQWHCVWVAWRC